MGFSRQEHWSGMPFSSPGVLTNPGNKPMFPALQADSLPTELQGKPIKHHKVIINAELCPAVSQARTIQDHHKISIYRINQKLWFYVPLCCPFTLFFFFFMKMLYFFFSFIFICWRLITLQYCSGFCHILTWISHGFTCIPHPNPPAHLPLHPIPLGLPSAPGPSTCFMHPTWAGGLFHPR